MNIDNNIKNEVKKTLLTGGNNILDIGCGAYLQVISDLKEDVFKILYLVNNKPELNIDNAIGNSVMLSNQTQEVIDNDKYMISIVEKLDNYHYTKFTHLDYRNKGIMSEIFNIMNDVYPLDSEWTERIGVYKFLLKNGFRVKHIMNFPNLVRPFTEQITDDLEKIEKEGTDILPYRIYFKNIKQEFLLKIEKLKHNGKDMFYNTTGYKDAFKLHVKHLGFGGRIGYIKTNEFGKDKIDNKGMCTVIKDFQLVDFETHNIKKIKAGEKIEIIKLRFLKDNEYE